MTKRRFKVFFLALALVLSNVMAPITAMAAEYSIMTQEEVDVFQGKEIMPGDVINYKLISINGTPKIYYYDLDDTLLYYYENTEQGEKDCSYEIKGYEDASFTTTARFMPPEYFKAWKVTYASTGSGNVLSMIKLNAIPYQPGDICNIQYELDGGTNSVNNPDTYVVGTGVASFEDATKEGYTFEGWYSDNTFEESKKVTSISDTQCGDVTLYAKFTAKTYPIQYELDGGTNATQNPSEYTYVVGVKDFENATKEGYTFEGWYAEAKNSEISIEYSKTEKKMVFEKGIFCSFSDLAIGSDMKLTNLQKTIKMKLTNLQK